MLSQLSLQHLKSYKSTGIASVALISSYMFARKLHSQFKIQANLEKRRGERLVVISGCDSGLGYSMASWAATLGYRVLAGCLNDNGEGPQKLLQDFPDQIITTRVNVTQKGNLEHFRTVCRDVLETHEGKLGKYSGILSQK